MRVADRLYTQVGSDEISSFLFRPAVLAAGRKM